MNRSVLSTVFLLLLTVSFAHAQSSASLRLPSNIEILPDDTLVTPLTLSTDSLISAALITFEYDSMMLEFIDARAGQDIPGYSISFNKNLNFKPSSSGKNKNVQIKITSSGSTPVTSQNIELAKLNWYVTGFEGYTTILFDQIDDHTILITSASDTIGSNQIDIFNPYYTIIQNNPVILSLKTDTTDILEGEPFAIAINVADVPHLNYFSLAVSYNPLFLTVDSISEGSFLSRSGADQTTWSPPKVDKINGLIENIKCERADTLGVSRSGNLATVYFRALMAGSSPVQFIQDRCKLNNATGFLISVDAFEDLSLNIYRQPAIELALPDTFAAPNRTIDLPLRISGVENFDIISALIEVQFDSACLKGIDVVSAGTLTEDWQPPVVNSSATSFYFALAGSAPLTGDGVLVYLRFFTNVNAQDGDQCDLKFGSVMLNEGGPTTIHHDGTFRIRGLQIAGAINYAGSGIPITNAELLLSGEQPLNRITDENGNYSFNGLHFGNFSLFPQKSGSQGRAITPFDAALILQHIVGNSQLTPFQMLAADVSGDSSISAFDASYIMRYSVNLESQFPAMGDSLDFWNFVPAGFPINDTNWVSPPDSLVYNPLEQDQFNQDFIGIIYGDVSQNWVEPALPSHQVEQTPMIATLNLGEAQLTQNAQIELPLYIEGIFSIYSAEIEIEFDNQSYEVIAVVPAELSRHCMIDYNCLNAKLKIAIAGAEPITASGALLKIVGKATNHESDDWNGKFHINRAWLNDQLVQIATTTHFSSNQTIPKRLDLSANYPNPFNQETVFHLSIPETQHEKISLVIYNLRGQVVRKLVDRSYAPGTHSVRWNGTDDFGRAATTGEYFCVLKAGTQRVVRKVVLVR